MRKVLSKSEVCHLWANQTQSEARTSTGNIYFRYYDKIYSYGHHYMLGQHVTNDKEESAVLLNEKRFSNTTAKHQSILRNATGHLKQIFVPNLTGNKEDTFAAWIEDLKEVSAKLSRAKKPEIYINDIKAIEYRVKIYTDFFGYTIPAELKELLSIDSKEVNGKVLQNISDLKIKAEKLRIKESKKRDAENKKNAVKALDKWRNFEINDLNTSIYSNHFSGYSYLRFNQAKNRIETSQGIEVPFEIGKRFYNTIIRTISAGGCSNCDLTFMNTYKVLNINSFFIEVGCHKISIEEVNQIAKQLNF